MMPWIIISIIILLILILLAVIFIVKNKDKRHEPDYYSFFWIGLIWTIFGIFSWIRYNEFNYLFAIGIIFLILGLVNKDKWKKNHRTWKQLSKSERKWRMWIIIILGILVLIGLIAFFLVLK